MSKKHDHFTVFVVLFIFKGQWKSNIILEEIHEDIANKMFD